jgi:hypothetical protein
MKMRYCLTAAFMLATLAACSSEETPEESGKNAAAKISAKPKTSKDIPVKTVDTGIGTPMAERVAILGLLNKRNGDARDIELKPGQDIRIGKVVLRLRACEKTAPWETYPDQGAFVQLIVNERPPGTNQAERWRQVFSGWLFKENPAANVVQHPIYDVWVKECRMSFPGEEDTPAPKSEDTAEAKPAEGTAPKKPSSANQSAQREESGEEEAEAPAN